MNLFFSTKRRKLAFVLGGVFLVGTLGIVGASNFGVHFGLDSAFAADETSPRLAHRAFPEVERAAVDRVFENLRPAPRLFLTDASLEKVRRNVESDPRWQAYFDALKRNADKRFEQPPVERKLEGRRLLGVSREALGRIFDWSFLYRYTGDAKYARRVEREAVAIAAFSDWNPSHFLDVAEMTAALAIGYDACGETFSDENRRVVREAVRDKGVRLAVDMKSNLSWRTNTANWNQVCWCGTLLGALAIADDEPELAREAVWRAVNGVTWSMSSYEPDGNYTEGPGYWAYGTSFNVLLVAALDSALGNDFQRSDANGFLKSIRYYEHVFGATGDAFNYPDSGGGKMFEPTAFWFAQKLNASEIVWNEYVALDAGWRAASKRPNSAKSGFRSLDSIVCERLAVCALLWGNAESSEIIENQDVANAANIAAPDELGFVGVGNGKCVVALFRTAWRADAAYLGIKAGTPSAPHGHMDEGGFVYEDRGVRWIVELGPENYNRIESLGMNLWGMRQDSDRWKLLRYNAFGHSVPVFNGSAQLTDGLTKFLETKIGAADEASFATIDLTPVYRDQVASAVRKATLEPDGTLTIEDVFEALPERAAEVERRFVTRAAVEIVGENVATLTATAPNQSSVAKIVETTSDVPTAFDVVPAETDQDFDSKNPGVSILIEKSKIEAGQKVVYRTVFQTKTDR